MSYKILSPIIFLLLAFSFNANAHIDPINQKKKQEHHTNLEASFRSDCAQATAQIDLAVNNVRVRLLNGGDFWWDGDDGKYIVPNVDPNSSYPEISSIFAGGIWMGGFDPAGNLKLAAQTYGSASGYTDYWPGPLTEYGTIEADTCLRWDRFFKVTAQSITSHLQFLNDEELDGYTVDMIPNEIKGWPARGNEFFFDFNGWELPNTPQGLAPFYDENGNGMYEPLLGDYPIIGMVGCDPQYADEMIFWIYNDAGGIHTESTNSTPIQMEVQALSFAFATDNELNEMVFQKYKLINGAIEDIDSCYFGVWMDADLGCHTDDYIGCDPERGLAYVYNEDALDGTTGCTCDGGINTYCEHIPILGLDYFRGPNNEFGEEMGMSSFMYYENSSVGQGNPGSSDPSIAAEYYNFLTGRWRNGIPLTQGGDGYNPTSTDYTNYAFSSPPNDSEGWSMCTAGLYFSDRRSISSAGPFRLEPGAVNELIFGTMSVMDIEHPCPNIEPLLFVDDVAQSLFDNCFQVEPYGPTPPAICAVELDREVVLLLSNDSFNSNNQFENYIAKDPLAFEAQEDQMYRFEGYKIYQVAHTDVSIEELNDTDKARLAFQVDKKNDIDKIFNWEQIANPNENPFAPDPVWAPVLKVDGNNEGIRHSFSAKEDLFATGEKRLINHKTYYYMAIAYANNDEPYDTNTDVGQRKPYIESDYARKYTVIPRPIVNQNLHAAYGDAPVITRLAGVGVGRNNLELAEETKTEILNGTSDGTLVYKPGAGPIDIKIYNPLDVKVGEFELSLLDDTLTNEILDSGAYWELKDLTNNTIIQSQKTIDQLNEELIPEYGFSITIGQTPDVGDLVNEKNGLITNEIIYKDPLKPKWFKGIMDEDHIYDFIKTNGFLEPDHELDPNQALTSNFFFPYTLADWRSIAPVLSPAWDHSNSQIVRVRNPISELNNVDLVFTSDKSLWSRCVVVESANYFFYDEQFGVNLSTEGNAEHFDLRAAPSVSKDGDGNGNALMDGDGNGMGWFPGYAIDVETGKRLNVFFGENSTYDGAIFGDAFEGKPNGNDMIWNPSSQQFLEGDSVSIYNWISGGQHFVYVSRTVYDECAEIKTMIEGSDFGRVGALEDISWTAFPMLSKSVDLLSYEEGLIPNEMTVRLRVDNPYAYEEDYPTYQFSLEGLTPTELSTETEIKTALNKINVVPNPYYGLSAYEATLKDNVVKVTNLPANCTITIYTLDGTFVKQFNRNESPQNKPGNNPPIATSQIAPDLEWDLQNSKGRKVASGVYIIHVDAGSLGERVIKWFGVAKRNF